MKLTTMYSQPSLRHPATQLLLALGFSVLLSACQKIEANDDTSKNEPVVLNETIKFATNSTVSQQLITAPVVSAQDNILKLPARIVWDEDHTARISSPLAGHLGNILVQIGADIKANQPLGYLSSADLGSAQADAEKAKSDLAQAERNRSRNKELVDAGIIASKDLEAAQADLMKNKAESIRADIRLKSLGATDTVDQRLTIKSPIAGVLVERNTNPGMEYRPDQANPQLFVVSDPTYLWCWIDAPEQIISAFHKDMKVILRSAAWPSETYEAKVDFIGDSLDPVSRTLKIRAKLRNPSLHLKGEMYVTAELSTKNPDTLDLPAKAVFLNDGIQTVFVKTSENTYTRKTIQPVSINDQWVSIAQGLNKGDEVVLDGALYLETLMENGKKSPESSVAKTTESSTSVNKSKPANVLSSAQVN
ncbi:MAG: efflux RND transporter periplasmic adaptor subunit [Bacteroidia bacterium]|nr:efflux RND transporter periplasmic adaptor subunit [Methylotenera sp.]